MLSSEKRWYVYNMYFALFLLLLFCLPEGEIIRPFFETRHSRSITRNNSSYLHRETCFLYSPVVEQRPPLCTSFGRVEVHTPAHTTPTRFGSPVKKENGKKNKKRFFFALFFLLLKGHPVRHSALSTKTSCSNPAAFFLLFLIFWRAFFASRPSRSPTLRIFGQLWGEL